MSRIIGANALVCGFSLLALGAAFSGCHTTVSQTQPYTFVADLEVSWGIAGSNDPTLCDVHAIDQWVVSAVGPESRQSTIDCRADAWTSANDFFAMAEGNYQITVDALDRGVSVATQTVSYSLVDTGGVQPVYFDFRPEDFGVPF